MNKVRVFFVLLTTSLFSIGAYADPPPAPCGEGENDTFIDYIVDEDGDGTCSAGLGTTDFLAGSGVAKCAISKKGNVNCTCKGTHIIPVTEALILNRSDRCCVEIDGGDPMVSGKTFGVGTPSGILNATCQVKANQ